MIFKYIVSKFGKNACQTSGHCFVQVDIRAQNGQAEKAELPAARTGAEPGVFVANMRVLWYAVSAASAVRALTQNARRLCVLTGSANSPQSEAGVRRAAF